MDSITAIVISLFCLASSLVVIKIVRDNALMRNGEKVDAKVLGFQLRKRIDDSGHVRYRYEVQLKYNVTGADYQSELTMTRQMFNLAFPQLRTGEKLPELISFKPSDLNSVAEMFSHALAKPGNEPMVSQLYIDEEALESLTLPVAVDRMKPQRVVLNLEKVMDNHSRAEHQR